MGKKLNKFIDWLVDWTWGDVQWFIRLCKGKARHRSVKEIFTGFDPIDHLRSMWLFYVMIIFAFVMGMTYSSLRTEGACNRYIAEEGLVKPYWQGTESDPWLRLTGNLSSDRNLSLDNLDEVVRKKYAPPEG